MTDQLALFASPRKIVCSPPRDIDPVAGFVPMEILANDICYAPFDGAKAKQIILDLCRQAGDDWVICFDISRKARMYPPDLSSLCLRMVDAGIIESAELPSASGKGFHYGYRLPQQWEAA